ncbi:MAG: BON domain-containing protein [Bryobacterales bacterium]|nr:BON domain-containing protein [Bryobacterales bacterium]
MITKESVAHRPPVGVLLSGAAGVGIGALGMYLFDPDRGKRRRTLVRDKAVKAYKETVETVAKTEEDLINRAKGLAAEVKSTIAHEEVEDSVLLARIRSRMGHLVKNPQTVNVAVKEGKVSLEGKLSHAEYHALMASIRHTPGVKGLVNQLQFTPTPTWQKACGVLTAVLGTSVAVHRILKGNGKA